MRDKSALASRLVGGGRGSQVSHPALLAADSAPDLPRDLPDVAERLGCSVATIRRRIASDALHAVRHGRILRVLESDLQAFIQASRKWR
jgi:excisionase family DNA binding protein